jgi:hypothetical protein
MLVSTLSESVDEKDSPLLSGSVALSVLETVWTAHINGGRYWPPRALRTRKDAEEVVSLLSSLCKKLDGVPDRVKITAGAGSYLTAICTLVLSECKTDGVTDALLHMFELGVGVFGRDKAQLSIAKRNAVHCAGIAHTCGAAELGAALERLGNCIASLSS